MTVAIDHTPDRVSIQAAPTASENLVTLLGGIWLTAGLFIDGYAHANIINTETEDFFTPWHGIFYSGFAFSAAWIGYLMYRRRSAQPIRTWIPTGYGWAVVGIAAFAIGGLGDMTWHTIFGVEVGVDALLSPTHLLLLYGLIMVLAAPLQAVLRSGGSVWVATASVTMLALLAAFFTSFSRPLGRSWALTIQFDPRSGNDLWVSWMVGGVLLTTAVMTVAALYLIQRWERLPFGTITSVWAVPAVLEAYALSSTRLSAGLGGLAGGLVADALLRSPANSERLRVGRALTVGILITWAVWTAAHHVFDDGVVVPAEVWSGQVVLAGFMAAAIVMLAIPSSS
ncbi:MAG: hypothetical protein HKN24_13700, partial [Acidimicrobiales bacterium]|nr:hypothetical protein [Acidimicrobiales bacterium]